MRKKYRAKWSYSDNSSRPYKSPKYLRFRREVLLRDDFCCQWPDCDKSANEGCRIVVHHIVRWADNEKLRYEPKNGISLCTEHHDMVTGREAAFIDKFNQLVEDALRRKGML